ncbi:MAG: hypothetical protein WCT04_13945, partial [Planctomycetota bacterium]
IEDIRIAQSEVRVSRMSRIWRFKAGVCVRKLCFVGTLQTCSSARIVSFPAWVFLAQNEYQRNFGRNWAKVRFISLLAMCG